MFQSKRFWMYSTIILLIINLVVIAFSANLFINEPKKRIKRNDRDPIFQMGSRLNLTDLQRDELRDKLAIANRKKNHMRMLKLRNELLMGVSDSTFNETKRDSIIMELARLQSEQELMTYNGLRNLRTILDDQQLQRFDTLLSRMDRRLMRQFKRQKRRPGPPPPPPGE